jgi:hypothetical protein
MNDVGVGHKCLLSPTLVTLLTDGSWILPQDAGGVDNPVALLLDSRGQPKAVRRYAMTSYDSNILEENADALYSRASSLIASYAVAGAVVAWVGVYFLEPLLRSELRVSATYSLIPFQIMAAMIAAILGGVWGYGKGLILKLHAQVALCEMKIAENTSHLVGIELDTHRLEEIELDLSQPERAQSPRLVLAGRKAA